MNCREAQKQGKTFQYTWLLLTIIEVARELPQGRKFLNIEGSLPKAVRYNLLQAMKDTTSICEIKVFWIFMEASIRTWITRRSRLSPIVYKSLQSVTEFKADMHNLYIRAWKDPKQTWVTLPFITTDDAIYEVMVAWPQVWCTSDLAALERMVS